MAPSDDIQAKLQKAREAMESEERRQKKAVFSAELESKREKARLAMEGAERRARRLMREKEQQEMEEMRRQVDEEVRRRKLEEENERLNRDAEERRKDEEIERLKQEKIDKYLKARNVIEELKKETGASLPPIRTLKIDTARALKGGMSAAGIAIAQQKKGLETATPAEPARRGRNLLLVILIIFLVGLGSGLLYFVYIQKEKNNESTAPAINPDSIIFANEHREVAVKPSPASNLEAIRSIYNEASQADRLTNIFLTTSVPAKNGEKPAKGVLRLDNFIKATGWEMPNNISRFVDKFMLGTVGQTDSQAMFVILKINYYENVSAAMIESENSFLRSIFSLFTGEPSLPAGKPFMDKIVRNNDTRILTDDGGETILLYSFLDKGTLVITENEEAFIKIYNSYNTLKPKGVN